MDSTPPGGAKEPPPTDNPTTNTLPMTAADLLDLAAAAKVSTARFLTRDALPDVAVV
jgi:hypothetical protein